MKKKKKILLPPYWFVIYVDDYGQKHIAEIKEKQALEFIEDRYVVIEKNAVAAL